MRLTGVIRCMIMGMELWCWIKFMRHRVAAMWRCIWKEKTGRRMFYENRGKSVLTVHLVLQIYYTSENSDEFGEQKHKRW